MKVELLVLCFLCSTQTFAQEASVECQKPNNAGQWSYCVSRYSGSPNPDVVYFLHGKDGDEKSWSKNTYPREMEKVWQNSDRGAPTVVSVSLGPVWLLAEKNLSPGSGNFERLTESIIPWMEKNVIQIHGRRLLLGESMGSFNGSQLILKHPDWFQKAALACPVITKIGPHSMPNEIIDFVSRTKADPFLTFVALLIGNYFFPDQQSWEKSAPLIIGQKLLGPGTPKLHISCGNKDQYGAFEGAHAFYELAKERGVDATWEELDGGHCATDPVAMAQFLLE